MSTRSPPRSRDAFKIAIICALSLEADAVLAVFDINWEYEGVRFRKARGDSNAYSTGVIAGHPVVLVHMPNMGTSSASASAALLRSSFSQIQLSLIVGICGVAPIHVVTQEEIVLGDIIISTAVVQYDFGRLYPNGFRKKTAIEDSLGRATPEVRAFISKLQTRQVRMRMMKNIALSIHSNGCAAYPGAGRDHLYEPSYPHQHKLGIKCERCSPGFDTCSKSCDELQCEAKYLIPRQRHASSQNNDNTLTCTPSIHFGRFGSANSVMKSGRDRDRIAFEDQVIGFEMEGAGVWDHGPTIVIKAACDYADSHKNKHWQNYAVATGAACLKAFLNEWTLDDQSTIKDEPPPAALPADKVVEAVWHVPFDQLPGFIGRKDEIKRLKQKLFEPSGRRVVAILGLGGMGKSRLALEVAFQTKIDQPRCAILWIDASQRLTFEKDVRAIAKKLGLPGATAEQLDFKQLFKQGLSDSSFGKWLLIVDNADDEALWGTPANRDSGTSTLRSYLPSTNHGSVLITTRTRQVAVTLAGKELVNLAEPSAEVASGMFVGLLEDQNLAGDRLTISTLLEKLTFLPLAITQAASFINMTQISAKSYLNLLDQPTEKEVVKLLSKDFGDPSRYSNAKNPVASTWLISFKNIRKNYPLAAYVLSSMACYHEKNIPQSLLPVSASDVDLLEAIGVLIGYSFVRRHNRSASSEQIYDLHRLVQIAARNWLTIAKSITHWKNLCIKRTDQIFPIVDQDHKEIWTMYLPHARRLCDDSGTVTIHERYALLQKINQCFIGMGKYAEAVKAQRIVVEHVDSISSDNRSNLERLDAYFHFGRALSLNGDNIAAQFYLERGLSIATDVFPPGHINILRLQWHLGKTYERRGLLKEAEEQMVIVMNTSSRILGLEHPWTLDSMDSLARIYEQQGWVQKAEALSRQALGIASKTLGKLHHKTLQSMKRLGWILYRQHQLKEAEEIMTYVLNTETTLLEPDHPDIAGDMFELAAVYAAQHRYGEAEAMATKALEKLTQVPGPQHPLTLVCMHHLAQILYCQGKFAEAIELLSQCVHLKIQVEGADHPDTKGAASTLADWQGNSGVVIDSQQHRGPSPSEQHQEDSAQTIRVTSQLTDMTIGENDPKRPGKIPGCKL